jgi:hypothetical protein
MIERHWSDAEKKTARRAYEAARQAVLARTLAEFKENARCCNDRRHVVHRG